jgi:hypothetical protein
MRERLLVIAYGLAERLANYLARKLREYLARRKAKEAAK